MGNLSSHVKLAYAITVRQTRGVMRIFEVGICSDATPTADQAKVNHPPHCEHPASRVNVSS
jgi:hypothetical protein